MTNVPMPKYPMGKVSRAFFENVIARHLGTKRNDVAVGPANGVDVGVVLLADGRAMVSTTDPIYIVPQYGWERAAWFAFHILASDLTTSGIATQYITLDWNLPMDIEDDQIETMLRVMDRECKKYGAAIVTGHTGRYEGCAYPMVGGATFLAVAPKDGWVTADMARPGNRLLVTKTAALAAVSDVFGMDPLDAISEGTLLIAADPDAAADVIRRLKKAGSLAVDIGAFTKARQPSIDRGHPLKPADRDPFWVAFSRALAGEIA